MKRALVILLLGSVALSTTISTAFATTYVRVEKDGTKTYSDRPIPGGQPIDVQSAQTYSAPSTPAPRNAGLSSEQQLLRDMGEVFHYESCTLTPAAEQTFTNPETVAVGAHLKPVLRVGDVATLSVDGAPVGGTNTMSYVMKPAFRGAHSISLSVKDRYGRPLCDASSKFYVFQPTLNSPTRVPPPKPKPKG
jgi:hypothetical protein